MLGNEQLIHLVNAARRKKLRCVGGGGGGRALHSFTMPPGDGSGVLLRIAVVCTFIGGSNCGNTAAAVVLPQHVPVFVAVAQEWPT